MKQIFALFDTETSGLPKHYQADSDLQPRAIEFGGILTDGVEIIDTLEFYANPGFDIEQIITDITGITNDTVQAAPPFDVHIDKVASFFGRATAISSHNLSFDKGIIREELRVSERTFESINWPKIEICTVEQFFEYFGRRMKLTELYNMYIGEYEQKHRALDDVLMAHEVCKKLGVYSAFNFGEV